MSEFNLDLQIDPELPKRKDFRIGIIGAGFIVREQHLVAYRDVGFTPYAITSLDKQESVQVAERYDIPHVYDSWKQLIVDPEVEILDIAVPPDCQVEIVQEAVKQKHIKGILCQKPLAMNLEEAKQIVQLCKDAEIKLGVNSNMRYDPSIRALKTLLNHNILGTPVLSTIEMRAIPHWQAFLQKYDRIEILNMGIHHVDAFRYLFGDPVKVTALTRRDPRTAFRHIDGISQYTFQYENELMASSLDDVWAWPGEGTEQDFYIKWRVVGEGGLAEGQIFWYAEEPTPSTIKFTSKQYPNQWIVPKLNRIWFPDAFRGTMAQLLCAVEQNALPEINGEDNLHTMAAIDACYRSIAQEKTIEFADVLKEAAL